MISSASNGKQKEMVRTHIEDVAVKIAKKEIRQEILDSEEGENHVRHGFKEQKKSKTSILKCAQHKLYKKRNVKEESYTVMKKNEDYGL